MQVCIGMNSILIESSNFGDDNIFDSYRAIMSGFGHESMMTSPAFQSEAIIVVHELCGNQWSD